MTHACCQSPTPGCRQATNAKGPLLSAEVGHGQHSSNRYRATGACHLHRLFHHSAVRVQGRPAACSGRRHPHCLHRNHHSRSSNNCCMAHSTSARSTLGHSNLCSGRADSNSDSCSAAVPHGRSDDHDVDHRTCSNSSTGTLCDSRRHSNSRDSSSPGRVAQQGGRRRRC